MKTKSKDIIMQDKAFRRLSLTIGLILSIPLVMTQISDEWDWGLFDFIVIGALLFGMGSLFILVARKIDKKYRIAVGILFLLATLYIWAELAVGIFTNIGS